MGISFKIPAAQDLSVITRTEAEALALTLNEFVELHKNDLYRFRKGALVLDGQIAKNTRACAGASILNLGFADVRLVLWLTLPAGEGTIGSQSTRDLAANAIDALQDGDGIFSDCPNSYLDAGIYRPFGGPHWGPSATGSLLVLNTTFGRFLAGAADDFQMNDPDSKYDFILIATAFTLAGLFRSDKVLASSVAWMVRNSHVHAYFIDQIRQEINQILKSSPALSTYRKYVEKDSGRLKHLPFKDHGDK